MTSGPYDWADRGERFAHLLAVACLYAPCDAHSLRRVADTLRDQARFGEHDLRTRYEYFADMCDALAECADALTPSQAEDIVR